METKIRISVRFTWTIKCVLTGEYAKRHSIDAINCFWSFDVLHECVNQQ